jgi:hypothetical protein
VVYRRELRPVLITGAQVMDGLFQADRSPPTADAESAGHLATNGYQPLDESEVAAAPNM